MPHCCDSSSSSSSSSSSDCCYSSSSSSSCDSSSSSSSSCGCYSSSSSSSSCGCHSSSSSSSSCYSSSSSSYCDSSSSSSSCDSSSSSSSCDSSSSSSSSECKCEIDDKYAEKLLKKWRKVFPDAIIFPCVGYPSKANGVVTITHTMCNKDLKINGLPSKSPLANNALYSAECSKGKYLNLYEIMIPDIPGKCGEPSTAEIYVNALRDNCLDVNGVHFHWFGAHLVDGDRGIIAVHHTKIGMNPIEFTCRTLKALEKTMKVIKCRIEDHKN